MELFIGQNKLLVIKISSFGYSLRYDLIQTPNASGKFTNSDVMVELFIGSIDVVINKNYLIVILDAVLIISSKFTVTGI